MLGSIFSKRAIAEPSAFWSVPVMCLSVSVTFPLPELPPPPESCCVPPPHAPTETAAATIATPDMSRGANRLLIDFLPPCWFPRASLDRSPWVLTGCYPELLDHSSRHRENLKRFTASSCWS